MGATYTRQSTYTEGDVIQAADTNDEFDQLLAAFAASTGHTHDGTTGEGGPISTLGGHGITFGAGTAGTDIVITFDGETNDGVLKWMEDEDYFEFSDDILIASTEKIQFRDTAIFINSSTDGQLDIDADTELEITAPTVDINASTAVLISNDLKLDSDAAVLGFGADNDVTLTHVADTGLLLNSTMAIQFNDASQFINAPSATVLDINATDEIELNATLIDINGNVDVSGTLTVAGAVDFGDAALSNVGAVQLDSISGDADTDTSITFSGSDVITITTGGESQITFNNGSILPTTDDDVDLGSSALQFKDLYIDGTANIDTASIDALTVSGSTTLAATSFGDADITNVGSIALDKITNDGTDITLDSSGDIILDADGANVIFKDAGTSILDISNDSTDAVLTVSTADKNLTIKGTDGSSAITALDIDMALAGKATFNGDVVIGGDLTITGDDLVMGTNTSGHLLIADGTNFNPTGVGDLSEISTVANDDVFLAVDTSGGGLKKITRSTIVSGLATSSGLSNIVEDTSPQLGGNLDTNSHNILIDDAHFIGDENGNEQIIFQTTGSAVNQFDVTNAASGNAPKLSATGGDSNIDLEIEAKGTGHITVRGDTNAGAIQFNCESNSHGQILQSQPHSASVTNTMLLPAGGNSTLVSLISTDTLTNKTLTSPVINTGTFGTSILPVSADGTTLGSASKEFSDLFLADGAVISFGNDQEITLTHVADDGLILKHVGTGDGKEPSFSFHAGDNDIAINDVLGSIFFKAPDEGAGTDAVLVAAGIEAVSEGDFSSSNNATKLSFLTGASEAAAEKMSLSSAGLLTIADDLMIKDGGTIGVASTNDAITISSAGIVTFKDDIIIKDGGTIGSTSDADAITIGSDGDITLSQDLELQHDGSTISFGANDDVVLTHVHDTGLLLNAAMVVQFRDSAINIGSPADGDLDINADDEIELNSTLIDVNGNLDVSGTIVGASTLSATTGTFSGVLKTDDATEATSTTDGSLQTDGGLSVVKDAVIGDDLKLLSDASVIHFGADSEVTLTHVADVGLALKHTATADDKPIVLTLQTGETDMAANDVIGKIAFQAPDEGTGTDAILVSAAIQAVAEGDFSSSNNATRLEFHTGASEAAASKMTLSSGGVLDVDGGITVDNITIDGTEIDLSSGDLTLDVAGDIILDADGGDFKFQDGGTEILRISNSSSDVIIKPIVDQKDLIFQQRDGTEVARIEDNATFDISAPASIISVEEKVTVNTSTSGTLTVDTRVQGVVYLTGNMGANRTINFSNANANMAANEAMTFAVLATQAGTAYYFNTIQVDGSSVTPKVQGGEALSEGNASGIDAYSFTLIKTADATFTVLVSQSQFA